MFYSNNLRPPSSNEVKPDCLFILLSILTVIIFLGCSDDSKQRYKQQINPVTSFDTEDIDPGDITFAIVPKYSYIRSYPGGGGIFVVGLLSDGNSPGSTILSLDGDSNLHSRLSREKLNGETSIAEITVEPDLLIETGDYELKLMATNTGNFSHNAQTNIICLKIEVLQWGTGNVDDAVSKRDEFVSWLEIVHPELGGFAGRVWNSYQTYPQILVVEHWTFLDKNWEFRLCYHVMIPPYDWSMIMLRRRGEWNPALAAKRETDGTIHEIPLSDYPIMYGY